MKLLKCLFSGLSKLFMVRANQSLVTVNFGFCRLLPRSTIFPIENFYKVIKLTLVLDLQVPFCREKRTSFAYLMLLSKECRKTNESVYWDKIMTPIFLSLSHSLSLCLSPLPSYFPLPLPLLLSLFFEVEVEN